MLGFLLSKATSNCSTDAIVAISAGKHRFYSSGQLFYQ